MTKLRPFQLEGVKSIYHFKGRCLLADEMGLGKTIEALYWLTKIPKCRPALIVTPATMKWTWQAEAAEHFNLRTEVLNGQRASSGKLPGDICIINYNILPYWLDTLKKNQPAVLILDESHYIKNRHAQRTKCCYKLSRKARSVLGLTGTPVLNHPIELWSQLQCIKPKLFPSFIKYAWEFCKPKWTPWGWSFTEPRNKKKLNRILREEVMVRRLKKNVMPELPAKIKKVISLKLKSYREYDAAEKDIISWLRRVNPARVNRAKRNKALTRVGYLLRLVADLKMDLTIAWLQEWAELHPEKKMVGLTMHTKVIDRMKSEFPNCVVIDGRVTGKLRTASVRQFQNNKKIRWLWGNWKAAGIGVTATAAHHFVSLDFPFTPSDLEQGEDRTHRIGQNNKVIVYYLVALDTIEERLMKMLRRKAGLVGSIIDGKRSAGSFNVLDELLAELRHR